MSDNFTAEYFNKFFTDTMPEIFSNKGVKVEKKPKRTYKKPIKKT